MKTRNPGLLAALLLPAMTFAQADTPSPELLQVEDVRCAGNQQTSCDYIREHLYLQRGSVLNEEEIRNAQLRLSASQNFDSIRIHLEKGSRRGTVIVVIEVRENSPIAIESIVGGSFRMDREAGIVGSRIAHQNLFGRGKYAELSAVAVVPFSDGSHVEGYEIWLRYADPQLFNSRRWFGVAAAGWRKHDAVDSYGNFSHLDTAQFDLSAGWRFANFSYLKFGASYRPDIDWQFGTWEDDGVFDYTVGDEYEFTLNIAYGWSSEDDLQFPTQGSTFQIAAGGDYGSSSPQQFSHVQFRKTWSWLDAYWTVKIGGEPIPEYRGLFAETQFIALTYARPLPAGDNVIRGRWYVEPGLSVPGYSDTGEGIVEAGLKLGYRADTRLFGVVDLYLMGSVDLNE